MAMNKGIGGGAMGMPGAKKNKSMNTYANGGPVMTSPPMAPAKMKTRGTGAATKGLTFDPE